jgi:predicted nucleic acid-binding Zn ribbon protein
MSPRRESGEPIALGDSVAAVGRELGMAAPDAIATVAAAWPEIVGDALVGHAEVRSIRDGVCTIAVDGSGWATQLRYAERQVVERAHRRCGPGVVTSIRVVVAGPERPGKSTPGTPPKSGPETPPN